MNVAFIKQVGAFYFSSFTGFRKEVWLLAAITLVNRAGSMVIPFLSLYLTKDQLLEPAQVGWIMSCFGGGSVLGSWLGGKLTDRIGFYKVMVGTLFASGLGFIGLQWVHGFFPMCVAIFFLTTLVDGFRPGMFVAVRHYATPENRTRAVTLIRLAINLGFSMGPAVGGLIISYWSYAELFWVDGLSCLGAVFLMLVALKPVSYQEEQDKNPTQIERRPSSDAPFLMAMLASLFLAIPFLQYFSTMPLYYREVHNLDEFTIGLVLGFNGLLIFLLEMPLIRGCEDRKYSTFAVLRFSALLISASFLVLLPFQHVALVWVGMTLLTVGEMLNFPFMNRFVYDRADKGQPGAYMAAFTITWSIAHIFGHTAGLNMIQFLGYETTWMICAGMVVVAVVLLTVAERKLNQEQSVGEVEAKPVPQPTS